MAKHVPVPEGTDASHYFSGSDSKSKNEARKKRAAEQASKAAHRISAARKHAAEQGEPGHPLIALLDEALSGDKRAIERVKEMFGCTPKALEKRLLKRSR